MRLGIAFFSGDGSLPNPLDFYMQTSMWADARGFTSTWTPERHFQVFGGAFPEPAVAVAAAAGVTKNIRLRSGCVISPRHEVASIVERWAMVDCLSHGRVSLTLAPGARSEDFLFCPDRFDSRRSILRSQICEIRQVWKTGHFSFQQQSGVKQELPVFPRPKSNDIDVSIAVAGAPASYLEAADCGAGVYTHLASQTLDDLAKNISLYRANLPRGVEGEVALLLHTFVAETDDAARSIARKPLQEYLLRFLQVGSVAMEGRGQTPQMLAEVAAERYLRGRSLIGSRSSCLELLSQLEKIGVNEVACLVDFGVKETVVAENLRHLEMLIPEC